MASAVCTLNGLRPVRDGRRNSERQGRMEQAAPRQGRKSERGRTEGQLPYVAPPHMYVSKACLKSTWAAGG